ncbi:phosphate/phosphite/phosphonate ABC transporter substrate-binding protein (plasmid) [Streptomyces sp. NBC_00841]|uniref:phosphate/phosphite/phosphonate ABC transporter substrate-binding protein n=1 Tax=unclassified Streptomyces TaxID=2593676 RepID=UPI0022510D8C|nr:MULTISPECIES: phosphate/phosphite/phosphonate ABC transporter substrate-binding protein [unclassified Streptomyces]MCX4538852.1 phosphate/phosphite/phosphonate ABC transporter substrate-binding protein [Streptomyces sp. NBC_01669]WSA05354.1 phosphate/phosphite/phosphonate ABC transporter substrate-binding protein [Streptomyces sp. NBC_00841]
MSVRRHALVGTLAAALALTACSGPTEPQSATCPGGKIRFGVEPFEDPARLTPAAKVLADALGESLNCPVELIVTEDYSAEVLAMENRKLDIGIFGPLGYVFASKRANAEAVASFGDAAEKLSSYTAGIWVPKNSDITSINQLRDHTLALSSVGSTSGDALPRKALIDAGMAKNDVRINYAGGHPEALLALTNGAVDAAEINSQQLASATAAGTFDQAKYRRIWSSDPIPNDPITVRGDHSAQFKTAVRDALLKLPPAKVGKIGELLDISPPGPLVAVEKSTYQPLFDLASALNLTEKDV